MKADLTLPENQAAFKLQYYGLNCYKTHASSTATHHLVDDFYISEILKGYGVLSLRHISSLTLKERRELLNMTGATLEDIDEFTNSLQDGLCHMLTSSAFSITEWINMFDYLRRKSFLIPYAGNSCDDLIASGVAVYREERKEGA